MNSVDLVKSELKSIFNLVSGIEIRYEYKKNIFTHVVEIKPLNTFKNNELYIDLEIGLNIKFSKQFPNEEIVFISEESLVEIDKVDLDHDIYKFTSCKHSKSYIQ